jgi:hypothetical protein
MFENFVTGPIMALDTEEAVLHEIKEGMKRDWIPVLLCTRGELVENLIKVTPPDDRKYIKFVLAFMSYKKLFYDNK